MDNIIEIKNLTKKFKNITAVNNISFNVRRGEIFAFLGPNGAGKTTTIKMLITLLKPTAGGGLINGLDFVRSPAQVREIIGYIPQMISVDGTLTAYENLMLLAKLYGIPRRERKKRVQETLDFLKLSDHAQSLVRTFSGGMIRKLEIGQAMLHRPKILFLDEPTTGLDPVAKKTVWEHLIKLRDHFSATIFFSTHNMEEAEAVCQRLAIMDAGKIAAIGKAAELKEKTGRPDATLEDAFIFFTGNSLQAAGNLQDIRRARRTQQRLS